MNECTSSGNCSAFDGSHSRTFYTKFLMKHLSYFLLLCFFLQILLGNGGVFAALSGEQKGIILRNFKVQEKEMVFESNADML